MEDQSRPPSIDEVQSEFEQVHGAVIADGLHRAGAGEHEAIGGAQGQGFVHYPVGVDIQLTGTPR